MTQRPRAVPMLVACLVAAACQSTPKPSQDRVVRGTGLVVGLDKTASSDRETRKAILAFARDQGITLQAADVVDGSVARVCVTASLPAGATVGQTVEARCEAMDAGVSLRTGELLRCELRDETGNTQVVAQGPLVTPSDSSAAETRPAPTSPIAWVRGGIIVR